MNSYYLKYSKYLKYLNIVIFTLVILLFGREISNKSYTLKNSLYLPQEDFNNNKFEESLFGTDDYNGFFDLAFRYKGTKIDHIINLYIAIGLMNSEYYKEAKCYLDKISKKDTKKKYGEILASKIFGLNGDACVELKKYDEAILYYEKAINLLKKNYIDNPKYIMKMVLIYEEQKKYKKALNILEIGIKEYYKSPDIDILKTERKRIKILLESK